MACGSWKRIGLVMFLVASRLPAQPRFEVVSIRPVPANAPMLVREWDAPRIFPGGRYADARTTLLFMIALAYDMKNVSLDKQIVGLPNWAKDQSYSVEAKAGDGFPALSARENQEQVRLMMRSMLAERFHLNLHTETRQETIYKLEVSKGGVTLKEADPPKAPAKENPVGAALENDGGVRMVATKSTMAGLAAALQLLTGRPVVDETGLKGCYDFDVRWKGPVLAEGQRPETQFGGPELAGVLISNLQTQFGLRLTKGSGAVEYWVVDHVEQATGN
jgi:uncharacterized protein (TIGR03435 family)